MDSQKIISFLPYTKPFLFVDEITQISENGVIGNYTFKENEYFYKGHFINKPITPGVILTETMAQIGVVCLGIYLLKNEISSDKKPQIALTSNE
ncbi:MAG: hydroxymyristoyl-ACP dehydratase, partial [Flavobacteriaceae bacterium CG_4_8_14_3_um_filter_31_8]